jgi:Cdc6-like AAA superfamily ATPase
MDSGNHEAFKGLRQCVLDVSPNKMKMDYTQLPATWSRIIIDGDPGAGKTTLAKEIARECGAKVISFDEYLRGSRENYLQQLNYEKLQKIFWIARIRLSWKVFALSWFWPKLKFDTISIFL